MVRNLEAREHGGYNHIIPISTRRLSGDYLALLHQNTQYRCWRGRARDAIPVRIRGLFPFLCREGVEFFFWEILTMPRMICLGGTLH